MTPAMAARTKWTLRVERLPTRLAFGAGERLPVQVSLTLHGLADAAPREAADRIDLDAICRWITGEWVRSAPAPLLETRVNELIAFVFGFDRRVQEARVGVYKVGGEALAVGVERSATRSQFDAQRRVRPLPANGSYECAFDRIALRSG